MSIIAAAVGITYGLCCRVVAGEQWAASWFPAMSVGFIFGVPLAMGFTSVFLAGPSPRFRALQALIPSLIGLGFTLALAWEGLICIMLWLPLVVVLSLIGGLIAHLVHRNSSRKQPPAAMLVLFLPFLVKPVEPQSTSMRVVSNTIDIHATASSVWTNIAQVPAIADDEHGFAWSHVIGFPRPVAATIDTQGIGAVRHATFERNVEFIERVTVWDEPRDLAFDIDVGHIPAEGLDEHVTVGGPYFDVLEGHYHIEERDNGVVRLHLSSTHRLSTAFNAYAHLWTDFIMSDTQRHILEVIKRRCETSGAANAQGR